MASRMKVLLVDDDPLILDSIAEVLSFDGHDVAVAANGQVALACFTAALETQSPFDVVVTDLGMPGLNGIQVANEIRARSTAVRIILLTGPRGQGVPCDGGSPPRQARAHPRTARRAG